MRRPCAIMATGVFYREYDSCISGYAMPMEQASDGVNTYQFDGSNITLNLNGMVYSLNARGKQYMQKDMTAMCTPSISLSAWARTKRS